VIQTKVPTGVGVVHEVGLDEYTVGIVEFMSNRISARAGGIREEVILES